MQTPVGNKPLPGFVVFGVRPTGIHKADHALCMCFFGAACIVVVRRLLRIHTAAMEVHSVFDGTVWPVYHYLNCPRQTVVA
jgi:hypothetical protein